MGTLNGRLTALEALAEQARRRELRAHFERRATGRGFDPDAAVEIYERLLDKRA
jgi:hypothetical protein